MLNRITKFGLFLCLAAGSAISVPAQPKTPRPPTPRVEVREKRPLAKPVPTAEPRSNWSTNEKAIAADPGVAIKLCVSEGSVKINGTEANEVRVFVRDGRPFEFRSLEKNPESGKANWIWITSVTPPGTRPGVSPNCLAGESVQIDLPVGASVTLEARTAGAVIDSVKKVSVKIVEGNLSLRNITGGLSAVAHQGDVMVESSGGAISVETTTGNIVAFDVSPGNVGDLLKTRTNSGRISLQNVRHRQIEANSISGSVNFNGGFLPGGIYNFKTSAGSIRMLLPEKTDCRIVASYGFGSFNSTFPLEIETENVSSGGKSFVGRIGKGESTTVTLTTSSGIIGIRKQD